MEIIFLICHFDAAELVEPAHYPPGSVDTLHLLNLIPTSEIPEQRHHHQVKAALCSAPDLGLSLAGQELEKRR